MLVLGIESSCDETAAALVRDGREMLSSVISSQVEIHRRFGGVVPELASREHLDKIVPVVDEAFARAGVRPAEIDGIAVTQGPGLVGSLLVGLSYAKAMAYALGKPLVGVNHIEGHIYSVVFENPPIEYPAFALVVSGGHTNLFLVPEPGKYKVLARTRDDAAGEAFDKVAKLLGLPYPGGRHVETLAARGDPSRFRFSRPMLRRDQQPGDPDYFDVSFSGLKTAVLNAVKSADVERDAADIARGFQDALIDTLVEKTARAARACKRDRIVLGGGVACNRTLADAMRRKLETTGARVFAPTPRLATDNAAMIARAGLFHLERGERAGLDLNAYATLPMPGMRSRAA